MSKIGSSQTVNTYCFELSLESEEKGSVKTEEELQ